VALALQFHRLDISPMEGGACMKRSLGVATLVITLTLLGSPVRQPAAFGQEAAVTTKRKVKTRVLPDYPPLAKQMKVTGKVKIETTISADGHVTETRVVGGSPLLVSAALDAAKKWRFEPAAKETVETIEFEFTGN
jgi:TonB family protein